MSFLEQYNINEIEIWCEDRGRKADTYVYGWNINENELKDHLKIIKKKKGCNGSLKELTKETGVIKVVHLQGNQKDYIHQYLINIGISNDLIKLKL